MSAPVLLGLYGVALVARRDPVKSIIATVAAEHGRTPDELRSTRVTPALTEARRKVMLRATAAGHSQSAIGRALKRHPSTINHGLAVARAAVQPTGDAA